MLAEVLNSPSTEGFKTLWAIVDGAPKWQVNDPAKKIVAKPSKPRQTRPVKKELKYPCTCGKHERFVVKATGKVLPLCPSCHKAGKGEKKGEIVRLAAPAPVIQTKVPEKFGEFWAEITKSSPRRRVIRPQDLRSLNVYEADEMRGYRPNRDDRTKRDGSLNRR
jgi:hypothetical protein